MKEQEISDNNPPFFEEGLLRQQYISNQKGKVRMVDTRLEVQFVNSFPNNIVGFLRINLCDKNKKIVGGLYGSAILITPKTLLTCAHNFFPPTDQYTVAKEDIELSLSYHNHKGNECNIDCYKISPSYSSQETKQQANEANDFAIISLKKQIIYQEIHQLKCVWDMNIFKEMVRDRDSIQLLMFGYPNDKNIEKLHKEKIKITQRSIIGYQFKSHGNLIAYDERFLWHNMISEAGQSGSPIFYANHLIGIHKGYNYQKNQYYGIPLWSMRSFFEQHIGEKDMESSS